MRPIRDIGDVRPDSVLYHSAFGFARVVGVRDVGVQLQWERSGENLPEYVSATNLSRVYALCNEKGFFHCAMLDPEKLQELLLFDPRRRWSYSWRTWWDPSGARTCGTGWAGAV